MSKEPIFLTLDEAAEVLRLKDRRTVIKWGQEGRIRVVGVRRHLLVVMASIDAYARGESPWHLERAAPSVAPAGHAAPLGKRRARSDTVIIGTTPLLRGRKLRRK